MPRYFFAFFSLAVFSLILTSTVFAVNNITRNEVVTLGKDEVVNEDYLAVGEKVVLSGIVNGDAYLAGGNIVVDGEVNGDLLAAGGTITILGKVSGNARVGAGQAIVSGEIGKNLTLAGGSVEITSSAKVYGSLVTGAGNISIFAPIAKGASVGAGSATIGNSIGGNVNAGVGQITLTQDAKIAGNFTYLSDTDAQIQRGAQISGNTTHNFPPQEERKEPQRVIGSGIIALKIISFVSSFIIGVLIIKLFPQITKRASNRLVTKPFASLGIGFIAIIVLPIASLLLMFTVVGIPISIILIFALLVKIYIAKIFVAVAVGQKLLNTPQSKSPGVSPLLVGLLIYYLIGMIPVVGWIVSFFVVLIGLGAIIMEEKSTFGQLKGKI